MWGHYTRIWTLEEEIEPATFASFSLGIKLHWRHSRKGQAHQTWIWEHSTTATDGVIPKKAGETELWKSSMQTEHFYIHCLEEKGQGNMYLMGTCSHACPQ